MQIINTSANESLIPSTMSYIKNIKNVILLIEKIVINAKIQKYFSTYLWTFNIFCFFF